MLAHKQPNRGQLGKCAHMCHRQHTRRRRGKAQTSVLTLPSHTLPRPPIRPTCPSMPPQRRARMCLNPGTLPTTALSKLELCQPQATGLQAQGTCPCCLHALLHGDAHTCACTCNAGIAIRPLGAHAGDTLLWPGHVPHSASRTPTAAVLMTYMCHISAVPTCPKNTDST